jgi:cyclic lactone autoinducer peptide
MPKVKNLLKKFKSSNLVTSLALTVVAIAEVAADSCVVWILGQDDMPDELI